MNKLKRFILPYYLSAYKLYTLYLNPYKYNKERYLDSVSYTHLDVYKRQFFAIYALVNGTVFCQGN